MPSTSARKQRVEFAALEDSSQLDPVLKRIVVVGAIAWMRPQTGRLVHNAIHVEGIQADLLCHPGPIALAEFGRL
jgi:hypothetical protein